MRVIKVTDKEAGQRLDKLLGKYLNLAGKGFIYKMLRKKNITLNGKKCSGSEKVSVGDEVTLFLADETIGKFSRIHVQTVERPCLDIVYEDNNILLVNKPAGMLSQKAKAGDESLVEYVTEYLLDTGALAREDLRTFRPGVCNRLDRNTSGLVAAGKSLSGLQVMAGAFKDRSLHKYYYCLVSGEIRKSRTMEGYLRKDGKANQVKVYGEEGPGMAKIATKYEPVFQIPPCRAGQQGYTFLKITLITGRTHQIRAHLASIGHPVVGDGKYGDPTVNEEAKKQFGIRRQMLHSFQIEFAGLPKPLDYLSGKSFYAPLPAEFQRILGAEGMALLEGSRTAGGHHGKTKERTIQ